MKKPTIIFIASVGHSGSTLLDMTLGTHKEVFSVGEIRQSDRFFSEKETAKELTNCTCGVLATDCPIWSRVQRDDLLSLGKFRKYSKKRILISSLSKYHMDDNIDFMEYEFTLVGLYHEIVRETRNWIFVDSSKNPHHLIALARAYRAGKINLLVLRLEKDIPALMWSAKKKQRNPYQVIPEFIMHRYLTKKLIRDFNIPFTYTTYENLVTAMADDKLPAAVADAIENFTGVTYDYLGSVGVIPSLQNTVHHNIGGNGMRFDKIKSIRYDDAWRRNLNWFEKIIGVTINSLLLGRK